MIIVNIHKQYNFDSKLNRNESFNRSDTLRFGNYHPYRWILGFNDPVSESKTENQFTSNLDIKVVNGFILSYKSMIYDLTNKKLSGFYRLIPKGIANRKQYDC